MAESVRLTIITAVRDRLAGISVEAGYRTDVGARVFVNERPDLGPDDPVNAIAMLIGDFDPTYQGVCVYGPLPIEIQALSRAALDDFYVEAERVLADIVQAIETEDRALGGILTGRIEGGLVRTVPRDPGMTTAGVSITYVFPYRRAWGVA